MSPEPGDDRTGRFGHSGVVPIPKVIAAGAMVIQWEGLSLGLLSVESWPERTEIRIVGVAESDEAKQREVLHRQAVSAWIKEVERAHRKGLPIPDGPEHPLGDHAERLRVSLTDDAGTAYRWKSSGSPGGRSWEFVAEARFVPAPPADARELTVTFDVQDGPRASTTVALD